MYSMMLSDGNRFCRDVVLDIVNMAYKEIDSIIDQIFFGLLLFKDL